ncbi:MAG: hypothetical protein ABSC73_09090 [Acidimicrobiales bacterium]|jgi:hypothetical protein
MANTDCPAGSLVFGHPTAWVHSNLESGTPVIIAPDYGGEGGLDLYRFQTVGQPAGIPAGAGVPLVPNADILPYNELKPFPTRVVVVSQTQVPAVTTKTNPVTFTPAGTATTSTKKASAF